MGVSRSVLTIMLLLMSRTNVEETLKMKETENDFNFVIYCKRRSIPSFHKTSNTNMTIINNPDYFAVGELHVKQSSC